MLKAVWDLIIYRHRRLNSSRSAVSTFLFVGTAAVCKKPSSVVHGKTSLCTVKLPCAHHSVWENGRTVLLIFNLFSRWKWVVISRSICFTSRATSGTHRRGGWVGPRGKTTLENRRISYPWQELNHDSSLFKIHCRSKQSGSPFRGGYDVLRVGCSLCPGQENYIIAHPVGQALDPKMLEVLPTIRTNSWMDSLGNKNWSGAGLSKELMDKGGVRGHCNQVGVDTSVERRYVTLSLEWSGRGPAKSTSCIVSCDNSWRSHSSEKLRSVAFVMCRCVQSDCLLTCDLVQECYINNSGVTRNFFRGFNKFSWGQRTENGDLGAVAL
jgi:hypothetical protein